MLIFMKQFHQFVPSITGKGLWYTTYKEASYNWNRIYVIHKLYDFVGCRAINIPPKKWHKNLRKGVLKTHLKIFRIIIPSHGGRSTNFPSTSRRIHLWRSLQRCLFIIFRKLICTYTFLLCNLKINKKSIMTELKPVPHPTPPWPLVLLTLPHVVSV